MEDIIKTILDVVRAQHSAAEGTDSAPFDMDDIVDMAMGVMGRPDEAEEETKMMESIQKMVESLAPDLFPPKTFEQMDDTERAASAVSMIEARLKNGFSGRSDANTGGQNTAPASSSTEESSRNTQEVSAASSQGGQQTADEEDSQEEDFDAAEAADLNDMIYNNLMQMMGFQDPKVEYPFDRSQIRYGREKTFTEQLEEEKQEAEKEASRPLSAWELAQAAIDKDESAHQKEPYVPKPVEMPSTKSASQLAAEAIARSQEEDKMKLEIEKKAEQLMEEARKRGQDPMKFALHQQEILRYMEKNSDELVSFEDYEDLSPEEKLEIERQIAIEKQIEAGVDPDKVDATVPEEYIPAELREKPASEEAESPAAADAPVFTEEMLRQLSQEVIRENSDMILADNENEDMEGLNEAIFENIKKMMAGSGQPVSQDAVEDLMEQVIEANTQRDTTKYDPEHTPVQEPETPQKGLSAVELAKAAQKAAKPEPVEERETKSAVELAKEAMARDQAAKAAQQKDEDSLELTDDDLNLDDLEFASDDEEEGEESGKENPENAEEKEAEKDNSEPQKKEEAEEAEAEQPAPSEEEKVLSAEPEDDDDEYEYVDPDEMVLGEHTQAEIDEAIANLETLGLEGEVFERAKRMILLELAGSEAVLEAWLKEQEGGKKKKAVVSALDSDDLSDLSGLDEDALEKELEMALDEDFFEEEETDSPEEEEALDEETEGDVLEEEEEELSDESEESSAEDEEALEESDKEDEKEIPLETLEYPFEKELEPLHPDSPEEEEPEVVSETVKAAKAEKGAARTVGGSRRKKKVVRKKERGAAVKEESKVQTEKQEVSGTAEEKGYQVSLRKPFLLKNSASFMNQFEEYIADTQENRRLSTGFKKLDAMLRYGLHKGSYFIDAQPQYLKNSFMQQIADRAAEGGIDVLYISTELSRYDLMVDTISRLSYEIHQGDLEKAVSVMSIMTGEDGADLASLKDELNWYRGRISEHLYILDQEAVTEYVESMEEESAGTILAELIRSIVRDGAHKPAVFIDNIENILSTEDSEDMKPLMEGIRKLARELGIPIIMSYGYAQAESEEEMYPEEREYHESLGNMCDVYLELQYADMISEDMVELTQEDIAEMVEDGETLLIDVHMYKNRRPMKASCQIQGTPKYNHFEE
ncbi:MAG: DnaB helicase C-terminal domain-containing protein [Eubacterium sp.]|nr:DnaB helicase C-terminal domain-containing protein [Eubacterium sp.]